MNDVITAIKSRQSIRKWKNKPVKRELLNEILECGLLAPASHSTNPFELILVDNKNIIKTLLSDRLQHKSKPYWINSKKWAKVGGIENYTEVNLPPNLIVVCGDKDKCVDYESLIASTSCASENILLASHSLGLGAVWLYVLDKEMPETEKMVKESLSIPNNQFVLCIIALGYPDMAPEKRQIDKTKIHNNKW